MADNDQKPQNDQAEKAAEEAQEAAQNAEKSAEKAQDAASDAKEAVQEVKEEAKEEKKEESKPTKAVSQNLEKIIKSIEELSVLELSELVHALEEKFGVSAAAPMAVAAVGTPAGGDEGASEQTTFNVVLADGGANKISVIKAVRELVPTLGLAEAKTLVDSAPKPVLEGVGKEAANEAKTKLETAGAKVELK